MRNLLWIILLICSDTVLAQVKIGDQSYVIDASSILELESDDKVFVLTRMTSAQMNAVSPLNGALVYNTDENCIFVFEGKVWKTLCNSEVSVTSANTAPANPNPGDIWLNETDGSQNIWNGTTWIQIPKSTWNGSGPPTTAIVPDPIRGDIYVDNNTGDLHTYDGTTWIMQTVTADNGLTKTNSNTIELGGSLNKAVEIGTNENNTLAINGLAVEVDNTNAIVTVDETTGILKKTPISSFLQQEEVVIIANQAQTQFTPPLLITSSKKLHVYRNGVKLGFTVINDSTIELETPVICYQNDEIRIVQFF